MARIGRSLCLMGMVVFFCSVTSVESQSLVANKPTFSSLPLYSVTSVPELAVDGVGYDGSVPADECCFMTGNTTIGGETCWFALDLQKQYKLTSVTFTLSYFSEIHEALNAFGNLVNVTVGITNSSPAVVTPRLGNYRQCGRYNKDIDPSASTISLGCWSNTPPGRYVVVQQAEGSGGYLTICEIGLAGTEVFEPTTAPRHFTQEEPTTQTTMKSTTTKMQSTPQNQWPLFSRISGNNPSSGLENLPSYEKLRVKSDLECVLRCLEKYKDRCTSSYFIDEEENCQIARSTSKSIGGKVAYGKDWLQARISVH